jgi:hypothetical protein
MNLPHSMKLERSGVAKDEEGGSTSGPVTTIVNNEPCFVQPDNTSEGIEFHRLSGFVPYKVYVARDIDARAQDRMTILNGSFSGKVLNVSGQRDMAGMNRWFRIDCEDRPIGQHLQSG